MSSIYVALFGALFGGVGLKIVEFIFISSKARYDGDVSLEAKRLDDAVLIRQELRKEVTELKVEMNDLYKKLDESRDRYYDLQQKYNDLKVQYDQLKADHDELKVVVDNKA